MSATPHEAWLRKIVDMMKEVCTIPNHHTKVVLTINISQGGIVSGDIAVTKKLK